MANIHKMSATESLNVESSAVWDPLASKTVTSTWADNDNHKLDVSNYHQLIINTDEPISIDFQTTAAAPRTNTLTMSADEELTIKVPHGVGDTIYLNMVASSSEATVKIIGN